MIRTLPFVAVAALALAGCDPEDAGKPPPFDRLYFPSGLAFAGAPDAGTGVLYVANANSDKRFDFGTVMALDLSGADLPAFGAEVPPTGPVALPVLPIGDRGIVNIQSFAGEMALFPLPDGRSRLFVPSRAEGSPLQIIDAAGSRLSCFDAPEGDLDCGASAQSLVGNERTESGVPRANSPFGVGISADGDVFVTELDPIDSPAGSLENWRAYVVRVNALEPQVDNDSFIELPASTNSVAVGSRFAFLTGRANQRFDPYRLLTLVDRTNGRVLQPALEQAENVLDARGIALSSDEQRLYIAARFPDTLVVVAVAGANTPDPVLRVVRSVPLPLGANSVTIIPRPGRGELVAVTCSVPPTETRQDGLVVLYGQEVGDVVAQIPGVGIQPFGMAVQPAGAGARLFVSAFGEGRIAVIDIADLSRPFAARVVAHLGQSQTCITDPEGSSCQAQVTQ